MSEPQTQTAMVVVEPPAELIKAVSEAGLTTDGAASLQEGFAPHFVDFHELSTQAATIADNEPKAARAMRLNLRKVRSSAEKTRKELKADSLRRGKAIDGLKHLLDYQLVPVENRMEEIEKAEERREAQRIADLKESRTAELSPFADPEYYALGVMPEEQWVELLAGARAAHEAKEAAAIAAEEKRIADERAAEEARVKREKEEAAERERIKLENEALAKVAAEEKAKREAAEAKAEKERKKAQAKVEAENAKRDAAEAAQRKAEAAKLKKLEDEAEYERKKAAEAHRLWYEAQAKKAEEMAAEAAKKKAAEAAPDIEKLSVLLHQVADMGRELPAMATDPGLSAINDIRVEVRNLYRYIAAKVAGMEA